MKHIDFICREYKTLPINGLISYVLDAGLVEKLNKFLVELYISFIGRNVDRMSTGNLQFWAGFRERLGVRRGPGASGDARNCSGQPGARISFLEGTK